MDGWIRGWIWLLYGLLAPKGCGLGIQTFECLSEMTPSSLAISCEVLAELGVLHGDRL